MIDKSKHELIVLCSIHVIAYVALSNSPKDITVFTNTLSCVLEHKLRKYSTVSVFCCLAHSQGAALLL